MWGRNLNERRSLLVRKWEAWQGVYRNHMVSCAGVGRFPCQGWDEEYCRGDFKAECGGEGEYHRVYFEGRQEKGEDGMKKKIKWSFLVESDAENVRELDVEFYCNGDSYAIPLLKVIGVLRVDEDQSDVE